MRLAVDQNRQRLRAQRPGQEIGHPAAGIADAARPAARIARTPLRKAPARIARARREGIRSKCLRYLQFRARETGENRRSNTDRTQFPASGAPGQANPTRGFMVCSNQVGLGRCWTRHKVVLRGEPRTSGGKAQQRSMASVAVRACLPSKWVGSGLDSLRPLTCLDRNGGPMPLSNHSLARPITPKLLFVAQADHLPTPHMF